MPTNVSRSDIYFVKEYDRHLGELYEEAKSNFQVAPITTLVLIRELSLQLCMSLAEEFQIQLSGTKELQVVIELIKKSKNFKLSTTDLLHDIRRLGNKAAHPNLDGFDENNYKTDAKIALKKFCEVIDELNLSLGKATTKYNFSYDTDLSMQEIAYKAAYLDEAEAKHLLGKALIIEGQDRLYNREDHSDDGYIHRGVGFIESAAIRGVVEAQYDLGLIKVSNLVDKKEPHLAIGWLHGAANKGHTAAKAYLGKLVFAHKEAELYEEALNFLLEAVSENNNPVATLTLAKLYLNGEFLTQDSEKAVKYLNFALEQNYAPAIYMAAKLNMKEGRIEEAINRFEQCADAGINQANFDLGNLFRSIHYDDVTNALKYYDQFLENASQESPNYSNALYVAETLRFLNSSKDLHSHYNLVSKMIFAYQLEGCDHSTKELIESEAPELMKKYHRLFTMESPTNKDYLVPLLMVDKLGIPKKTMTEVFQKLSEVSENPRLAFDSFFTGDSVHPYQASNETKIGKSKEAIQQHESRIKQKAKNRKANKLRKKQRKKS